MTGTEAGTTNKEDGMTTQAEQSSQHLAAARELLAGLEGVTSAPDGDSQTKATAAAAHAILVLAEQVAVARVLMASDAAVKRANGISNAAS
jgi:hypothetical protein